jgi:acyl-CoA synthetase (AMP-forming)/AMP-acid ligase II
VTAVGAVLAPLNSRWSSAEAARSLLRCGGAAVLLLHPAATLHWHALVTQHAVRHIVLLNDQAPPIAMDSTHALVATAAPPAHMLCASRLVTSPHGVAVVCFTSGERAVPSLPLDVLTMPRDRAAHLPRAASFHLHSCARPPFANV